MKSKDNLQIWKGKGPAYFPRPKKENPNFFKEPTSGKKKSTGRAQVKGKSASKKAPFYPRAKK